MMVLHLVKKDFLLVKKHLILMMLISIALPLFMVWRVPILGGIITFIYLFFFTALIICQSISVEEAKYPKAPALLCSAPYPRSAFVRAKYIVLLLLFAYCYLMFTLISLVIPGIGSIDLSIALSVLLLGMILYGVYLPLYFRYGAEKTRLFFIIYIFSISFGTPVLYQYFANVAIDFSIWTSIPPIIKNVVLALANIVVWEFSQRLSIRIFSKKDL